MAKGILDIQDLCVSLYVWDSAPPQPPSGLLSCIIVLFLVLSTGESVDDRLD